MCGELQTAGRTQENSSEYVGMLFQKLEFRVIYYFDVSLLAEVTHGLPPWGAGRGGSGVGGMGCRPFSRAGGGRPSGKG